MKERRVLNQNKIPGSEILTRPEEISELSKYLGEKRKQLEDSLKADTTLLGVPGKTTGKIPTVSSLEESYERLRDDRPPIARLPQDMNRIGGLEKKIESLSGVEIGAEKLSNLLTLLSDSRDIRLIVNKIRLGIDQPQEKELSEIIERLGITWAEMMVVSEAIKIITSEHPEVQNLSEYIEHLGDTNRELLFLRTSEKLKVTHPEINLVTTPIERLYLNREDPKIKNLSADIPGEQKQNRLSTTKEELDNTTEELKDLKDSLIGLGIDWKNLEILFTSVRMISSTNPEVTELPGNTKDLPKDPREKDDHDMDLDSTTVHTPVDERNDRIEIELLDRSESPTLRPQEIDLLPTNKETLDKRIQQETVLESFKDTIEDNRENTLENFRDTLEDSRENSLVDYKDTIEDTRKTTLENFKDTIEDSRENSLVDYKDTLEDSRENSLVDFKDTLEDSREIVLDNFKDKLEDNRENNLENFKDKLEDSREIVLDNFKDIIEDSRENSLENFKDTLEDSRENTLVNFKDKLEDSRETILGNFKDTIDDSRETVLENFKDKLEDNRENSLVDYKDTLEDSRENSLVDYKDTIEDDRENTLVDFKDTLEDSRETILESFKDNLEDNRENSLSDYIDTIEDSRETTLDNFKDILEDNRENNLVNYKDTIEDNRENSLVDYKDTLEDNRENSLTDYKDTLKDNRENTLENFKDRLEDSREIVLDNFKDKLDDSRENSLIDYKDTIEDNRETTLENFKDELEDSRENSLVDYKDKLEDNRENNLENFKDTIEDTRETVLENFRDKLEDSRENNLVNFKDKLEDNRETVLDNFKDILEDNRENNLVNYKDTIEDNRENSLVDYKDTLEDNRETTLENFKDKLEDSRENSLSDYKDTLEDNREITLTDFLDSITDSRETTLENTRIDIKKPEDRELYDTLLAAPDSESENYWDSKSEGNELYDVSITLPDSVPENKLEKPITKIPGETSDISLETLVKDLPDSETDPISSLSGTIIKRADGKNEETIWNPEEGDENPLLKKIESLENEVEDLVGDKLPDDTIELGPTKRNKVRYWDPKSDKSKLRDKILVKNKIHDSIKNKFRKKLPSKLIELGEPDGEDYWDPKEEDNSLPSIDPLSPEVETEDLVGEELPEDTIELGPTKRNKARYWDPTSDKSKLRDKILVKNKIHDTVKNKFRKKLPSKSIKLEGEIEEIEELYDSSLSPTPDESTDFWGGADGGEELYDTLLSAPESQNSTLRKQVLSAIDSNNSDDEVFKRMMKLFKESEDKTEWEKKLESIMSGYLSDSVLTPERAAEYENKLNEMTTISRLGFEEDSKMIEGKMKGDKENIPEYKLTKNGSVLDALNMNNYVRFAAEKVLGKLHGSARRILLQETLAMLVLAREQLEKVTKANRDRLPGGDMGLLTDLMQGGVKGAVSGAVGAATKAVGQLLSGASGVDHTNPMNRPETNIAGQKKEKGVGITHYEVANDRPGQETKRGVVGALKSLVKSVTGIGGGKQESYKDKYFSAPAFTGITLMDLCSYTIPSSLDDLRNVLESSPYITTPTKFGTVTKGLYETYSLDTNNYWEVVIEPFCHDELNGGWSFLPAIQEINVENLVDHRITTAYNYWVPINSFELQKSKLTTKSLQLYDGEIIYPIGAEYTNELRITVVDDQLKSWRRYFEKCMEVAVYNSLPHDGNYYSGTNFIPTAVDKKNICIALYKNITFEIRIYIMNPQYHTLRKFDLLCVLKDFSEEYTGEIDGAGTDLNVSFSIVGENPKQNPYADKIRENAWDAADKFEKTISDTYENNSKSSSLIKLL